jgi:hypothetical protein
MADGALYEVGEREPTGGKGVADDVGVGWKAKGERVDCLA